MHYHKYGHDVPLNRRPKSWDSIEEPVVPLERVRSSGNNIGKGYVLGTGATCFESTRNGDAWMWVVRNNCCAHDGLKLWLELRVCSSPLDAFVGWTSICGKVSESFCLRGDLLCLREPSKFHATCEWFGLGWTVMLSPVGTRGRLWWTVDVTRRALLVWVERPLET